MNYSQYRYKRVPWMNNPVWSFAEFFRKKGKRGQNKKNPKHLLLPIELSVTVIMLNPLKAQDIQSCVSAMG